MKARIATYNDIENILLWVEEFTKESSWGWNYDRDNSINTLVVYINEPDTEVVVVEDDSDVICGFATLGYDNNFHIEKVGSIVKFYIAPYARGTTAARELTCFCMEWFKKKGCTDIFVETAGNIKNQGNFFKNLMGKFKLEPFGSSLHRRLVNE